MSKAAKLIEALERLRDLKNEVSTKEDVNDVIDSLEKLKKIRDDYEEYKTSDTEADEDNESEEYCNDEDCPEHGKKEPNISIEKFHEAIQQMHEEINSFEPHKDGAIMVIKCAGNGEKTANIYGDAMAASEALIVATITHMLNNGAKKHQVLLKLSATAYEIFKARELSAAKGGDE